jgi:hypothetical protein
MQGSGDGRRKKIVEMLRSAGGPVTGGHLSSVLGVSRQAIVNDIAILRAAGEPIQGSPTGYLWGGEPEGSATAVIACRHDREGSRAELEALVDAGVTVVDVVVEHQLYGEVRANLHIGSREDVDRYMKALVEQDAQPLSALTGGVHLHHLRASDPTVLRAAREAVRALEMLVED